MNKIESIGIGGLHRGLSIPEIYIENTKLQQENQQLKKQKDDVVEIIKRQLLSNTNITKYTDEMCLRDILRMLGEIE